MGGPQRGFASWYSFNDSLSQLVLNYVILLKDGWILFQPTEQTLESVDAQLVIVWQRVMEHSPGKGNLVSPILELDDIGEVIIERPFFTLNS